MSLGKSGLRLRRFRKSDLAELMAIERSSFGRDAYPAELFLEYFLHAPELFLVAREGSEMVGYSLAVRRPKFAELVSIAVSKVRRRSGAGKRLLDATVRRLRRAGKIRLNLMVKDRNRAARQFYETYGFEKVRVVRGYYEDGRDGVLMTLNL